MNFFFLLLNFAIYASSSHLSTDTLCSQSNLSSLQSYESWDQNPHHLQAISPCDHDCSLEDILENVRESLADLYRPLAAAKYAESVDCVTPIEQTPSTPDCLSVDMLPEQLKQTIAHIDSALSISADSPLPPFIQDPFLYVENTSSTSSASSLLNTFTHDPFLDEIAEEVQELLASLQTTTDTKKNADNADCAFPIGGPFLTRHLKADMPPEQLRHAYFESVAPPSLNPHQQLNGTQPQRNQENLTNIILHTNEEYRHIPPIQPLPWLLMLQSPTTHSHIQHLLGSSSYIVSNEGFRLYCEQITQRLDAAHHSLEDVITFFTPEFTLLFAQVFPEESWCHDYAIAWAHINRFFTNSDRCTALHKKCIILFHIAEYALQHPTDIISVLTGTPPEEEPLILCLSRHNSSLRKELAIANEIQTRKFAIIYSESPAIPPLTHIVARSLGYHLIPFPNAIQSLPHFTFPYNETNAEQERSGASCIFNAIFGQIRLNSIYDALIDKTMPDTSQHLHNLILQDITQQWETDGYLKLYFYYMRNRRIAWPFTPDSPKHLAISIACCAGTTNSNHDIPPTCISLSDKQKKQYTQSLRHMLYPITQHKFISGERQSRGILEEWSIHLSHEETCSSQHIKSLLLAYTDHLNAQHAFPPSIIQYFQRHTDAYITSR